MQRGPSKYAAEESDGRGDASATANLSVSQRLDRRFMRARDCGGAGNANDHSTPPGPSVFYPAMLYGRHSRHLDKDELASVNRLDHKFGLDTKRVIFNTKTFCEEFFAHLSAVIIGPFSMPIV